MNLLPSLLEFGIKMEASGFHSEIQAGGIISTAITEDTEAVHCFMSTVIGAMHCALRDKKRCSYCFSSMSDSSTAQTTQTAFYLFSLILGGGVKKLTKTKRKCIEPCVNRKMQHVVLTHE